MSEIIEYKDEKTMIENLPKGIIGVSPHEKPYQIKDMIAIAYRRSDGKLFGTIMSEVRIK
jgi:hypothetical protein